MKYKLASIALLLVAASFAQSVSAQSTADKNPLLADKFTVGVGAFIFDKSVSLRVDGTDPGENIDFDERWGIDSDEKSASVVMRWRFGEKWSLSGQYFKSDDSATATLQEDVNWEDNVFKAGTNVGVGVELSVARLFIGRAFSTGPKHEFGAGVGLHWLELGAYIEGEVFVDDQSTGFNRESVSADVPMPNIGGWYVYAPSPKWSLMARLDWLHVDIGDYSGGIWNSALSVNYQAFKHVGFGLAYQVFKLDVDVDKTEWRGAVELQYQGPFLSVTANW